MHNQEHQDLIDAANSGIIEEYLLKQSNMKSYKFVKKTSNKKSRKR